MPEGHWPRKPASGHNFRKPHRLALDQEVRSKTFENRNTQFSHQGRQEFKIMFKLFSASLIIAAACAFGMAQGPSSQDKNEPPSQGVAPKSENGVGRADVRVFDEAGNPIRNAYVKLESTRSDGFFCESWGDTDANGVIALPPIHMGSLKLKVKAKGFRQQELDVPADSLGDPVHVT